MASKNNRVKKQVRDVKGAPTPPQLTINPGNVPILTVKLLDSINQNVLRLIELQEKNG